MRHDEVMDLIAKGERERAFEILCDTDREQRFAIATAIIQAFEDDDDLVCDAARVINDTVSEEPFDLPPLPLLVAAAALRRALDKDPSDPERWLLLALICKWRGSWAEGLEASQKALELGLQSKELLWNAGICATGAGDSFAAAEAWLALGFSARTEGGEVHVSSRGEDARPESVLIERHSPCHGNVVSTTRNARSAVDYGDIVLWDGASRHRPFPLLARLEHAPLDRWRFLARQPHAGAVSSLAPELGDDIVIDCHAQEVFLLDGESPRFAYGKFVVPIGIDLRAFANHLDALTARDGITLSLPGLGRALQNRERIRDDERRWTLLSNERHELLEASSEVREEELETVVVSERRVDRVLREELRYARASGGYLGGLAAIGVAILLVILLEGSTLSVVLSIIAFPAGIIIGGRLGRRRASRYVCSRSDCRSELPPGLERCPKCRGRVMETVDQSAAELRLERESAVQHEFEDICFECDDPETCPHQ